jgi:outer membrane lipopolysaccharide assembly protein LptE/RlpB
MRQPLLNLMCLVAATAITAGCAGYRVGTRTLYHPQIRTVYVPVFRSESFRRNLGERLTEAVVRQIEAKTSYKVVSDPMADSQLTGRITTETKRMVTLRNTGDPRDTQTKMTVQIEWTDRRGNVVQQGFSVPVPGMLANVSSTAHIIPEAGSSVASSHQKTIDRLAEEIVSQLEIPW